MLKIVLFFSILAVKDTSPVKKCLDVTDFSERIVKLPEMLGEWAMTDYWTKIENVALCDGYLNVSIIRSKDSAFWAKKCKSDPTLTNLRFRFRVEMPESFEVPFSLMTFNTYGYSFITNPNCGTYGSVEFWKNGDYYLWMAQDKGRSVPVATFVPFEETARCIVHRRKDGKADFYEFCAYSQSTETASKTTEKNDEKHEY